MKVDLIDSHGKMITLRYVRAISTSAIPGHEGELVLSFNFTQLEDGSVAFPRGDWQEFHVMKDLDWEKA
jgi:hypothetical protein